MAWGPQPHQIGNLALNRGGGVTKVAQLASYAPGLAGGSFTFTAPVDGNYRFAEFGAGGAGGTRAGAAANTFGGGGPGYAERTYALVKGQAVPVVVGAAGVQLQTATGGNFSISATATTVSVAGQPVLTVSPATNGSTSAPGTGGVGSNGDINLAGGNGGATNSNGNPGAGDGGGAGGYAPPEASAGISGAGGGAGPSLLLRGADAGPSQYTATANLGQTYARNGGACNYATGSGFAVSEGTPARVEVFFVV